MRATTWGLGLAIITGLHALPASAVDPDEARFRALYRALVETDTTLATGDCTAAARVAGEHLLAAGFPAGDLYPYAAADHPKEGGLVAILPGRRGAKAILFVAHIDVVDASRADWASDPFRLVEADGYFHGRGVSDNKANAAALLDTLVRLRNAGYRPKRTLKVALTCGEETAAAFNGAHYLATARRELIDAEVAFVPSGGGTLDAAGRAVSMGLQAGEKAQQVFRLEARGSGSHASRPTPDNAIYHLAAALDGVRRLSFEVTLNPVTRLYFQDIAATQPPTEAAAIRALLADPTDLAAQAKVTQDPAWNGMLRTTCTATVLEAGGQANTVPGAARATINCRLLPDDTVQRVQEALQRAVGYGPVSLTAVPPPAEPSRAPPITPVVLGPIKAAAQAVWPGVTVTPTMLTGATDARHLNAVGIPAYGVTTVFNDPDGNGVHGPNERVRVRAVLEGRAFLYRWIKALAEH